ncbi:MAG TPA: hypothetical protein VKR06_27655 [Ktedonosporobacter sp.]|nr:hypothetical protein [Ktedonosporobacter sp.]
MGSREGFGEEGWWADAHDKSAEVPVNRPLWWYVGADEGTGDLAMMG